MHVHGATAEVQESLPPAARILLQLPNALLGKFKSIAKTCRGLLHPSDRRRLLKDRHMIKVMIPMQHPILINLSPLIRRRNPHRLILLNLLLRHSQPTLGIHSFGVLDVNAGARYTFSISSSVMGSASSPRAAERSLSQSWACLLPAEMMLSKKSERMRGAGLGRIPRPRRLEWEAACSAASSSGSMPSSSASRGTSISCQMSTPR